MRKIRLLFTFLTVFLASCVKITTPPTTISKPKNSISSNEYDTEGMKLLHEYLKEQGEGDVPENYLHLAYSTEFTYVTVLAYKIISQGAAFKTRSVLCGDEFLFNLPDTSCYAVFLDKNNKSVEYMTQDTEAYSESLVFPEWTLKPSEIINIRDTFLNNNRWGI